MIEVQIDSVRASLTNPQRVVVLKDVNSERYLPIWIGQFEAEAIAIELQGVEQKRPLTHDLLKSVISALGGKVRHIYINDIRNAIFYARIVIDVNGQTVEVDSRPSDAIALAVRVKCGIFVSDAVMASSSVVPEEDVDLDEEETPAGRRAEPTSLTNRDDEIIDESKLSAFADFLNSMKFDDEEDDS